MARKFFNQKVHNTKRTITQIVIICVCIIGVILCFYLVNYFNKNNNKDAIIEMRDSVATEINTEYPDKTVFFEELENVKEDDIEISYADADITKVGEYPVVLKIYNKTYKSKLIIVDTIAPVVKVKDVSIEAGKSYKATDFVESCTDNSKEKCKVAFYTLATDQDGNKLTYDNFTTSGTYKIQIVASDSSDNTTISQATLTIGKGTTTEQPTYCKYGNNEYNKNKYIMATDVTENGCALDLNLYQDENVLASVKALMESETTKLKKEFSKLNVTGTITLERFTEAILNTAGTGIVGYTLQMELKVDDVVVEKFQVDQTGKRIYSLNKYYLD